MASDKPDKRRPTELDVLRQKIIEEIEKNPRRAARVLNQWANTPKPMPETRKSPVKKPA